MIITHVLVHANLNIHEGLIDRSKTIFTNAKQAIISDRSTELLKKCV